MKTIVSFFLALHKDESGASFIEYTALLGVILAVGIGILVSVGTWASGTWSALCSTLGSAGGVACTPPPATP
ncbi:Flp family type IVb pilin [Aestuariivirga sp.]|uniref:Flp family type IVb pilin n=1 Tax=Aestuariivirga sp. TaxID=2650926 RepID=UPI00391D424D